VDVLYYGVLNRTSIRRSETASSRQRRLRKMFEYKNVTKKQFKGYALGAFIGDMRDKISEGRWRDDDGKLAAALDQLAKTAFGDPGIEDWQPTEIEVRRLQIIDQITEIAIKYGWIPKTGRPVKRPSAK